MNWEMTVDAATAMRTEDLPDLLDALLTTLEEMPAVLGPVTSGNLATGSISARFDIQSPNVERAVTTGIMLFSRAAQSIGLVDLAIQHAEITREHELVTSTS